VVGVRGRQAARGVRKSGPSGRPGRQDEVEEADVLAEPDDPPEDDPPDDPPDDDPLEEEVDELDELVEAGAGSTLLEVDRESVR
jgi:hypothetical protein